MLATPSSSSSSSSNTCAVKSAPMHCRRAASSHCTRTDSLAAGSLSSSSRGRDRQRCDTPTAPKSTALIDILLECIVKHKVRSNAKRSNCRTRASLPCVRTDSQATGPLPQARRNFQRGGGPQRNADSVAAGRNGQGPRDRDRYRSLTLDCCRPHHTIAHVWARLPGAAISRGTHSRPSRRHLLQASSKSAPHATLALWHARHARFCGSLSSEGQSRPNRHEQRELI